MLKVLFGPEKDWNFNIGDLCVLNSGSPMLTVVSIELNGDRVVSWSNGDKLFQDKFPSICLRPHFLARLWKLNY